MDLPGGAPAMDGCEHTYQKLSDKYRDFSHPVGIVLMGGKRVSQKDGGVLVDNIRVEASSGFESSVASFRLYDVYNMDTGCFDFKDAKKQVILGNTVEIMLGYLDKVELVFAGYVSGITFDFSKGDLPYVEITAMDIKGLMMGGCYAYSLSATTYSAAVKEILDRTGAAQLSGTANKLGKPEIEDTPDAKGQNTGKKSSPITVEMVNESDYEFVVRAAKRYNYEFFVDRGVAIFRSAKKEKKPLIELSPGKGLRTYHVEYSITGVVGKVEARAMDPGQGKVISAKSKFDISVPKARKAKSLVGSGTKVYVDSSITSQKEADARVQALMEEMSYRLGSLEGNCIGIPELVPGRFLKIKGLGKPADNQFYVTKVVHELDGDQGYRTLIEGCAAAMKD